MGLYVLYLLLKKLYNLGYNEPSYLHRDLLGRGADVPRVAEGVDTLAADQLDGAVQIVAIPFSQPVGWRMAGDPVVNG